MSTMTATLLSLPGTGSWAARQPVRATLPVPRAPASSFWTNRRSRAHATDQVPSWRKRARVLAVTGNHQQWDEARLIALAKQGDQKALGTLLTHHGPRLYRAVLLPRLGNEARAKDALSATYLRVVQKLHRYEPNPRGMYPWLRVIAMRVALDMIRGSKRETLFDADDMQRQVQQAQSSATRTDAQDDPMQERYDLELARQKLHAALDTIPDRYAKAIRLRILEDRPRTEVANMMGVSPATFDVLLHRSVAAIKKALKTEASSQ